VKEIQGIRRALEFSDPLYLSRVFNKILNPFLHPVPVAEEGVIQALSGMTGIPLFASCFSSPNSRD
jgi:hypothetical protein